MHKICNSLTSKVIGGSQVPGNRFISHGGEGVGLGIGGVGLGVGVGVGVGSGVQAKQSPIIIGTAAPSGLTQLSNITLLLIINTTAVTES